MIQTVLGPVGDQQLGLTLPHEHVLVGFIPDGKLSEKDYDRDEARQTMLPYLKALKAQGCNALAECTPEFLGRDPELLAGLSRLSGLHILTNTGFYQAPYLAPFVYQKSARQLADIWVKEAREGIGESGIRPGFIKIALSNGGPLPEIQRTILRAALLASAETGLAIMAHTIGGEAALEALGIMREAGFDPRRFIWTHADSEPDLDVHQRMADAGAWLSVDSIGWRPLEEHADLIMGLLARGLEGQLLLSHDAGWYHVGEPGGGEVKPYTTLLGEMAPLLKQRGLSQDSVNRLLIDNPARALAVRS